MIQKTQFGLLSFCVAILCSQSFLLAENWEVGLSRLEITPTEPLRLSGYGNRSKPFEGIDTPLNVRCMAMRSGEPGGNQQGDIHILLSVDTIGFPAVLTNEILQLVQKKHTISREHFVICSTHTHTAPPYSPGD